MKKGDISMFKITVLGFMLKFIADKNDFKLNDVFTDHS